MQILGGWHGAGRRWNDQNCGRMGRNGHENTAYRPPGLLAD